MAAAIVAYRSQPRAGGAGGGGHNHVPMVHLAPLPCGAAWPAAAPSRRSLPVPGHRANGDCYQTFEVVKPPPPPPAASSAAAAALALAGDPNDPLRRKYVRYLHDSGGIEKFRQEPEPGLLQCCERKVSCCTCCCPRGQMNTVAVSVICVCVIVFIVLSPLLHFMVPT